MNDLSPREQAMLSEWSRDTFAAAVAAGWVTPPWRPSPAMLEALAGYYGVGMTPAEGAEALFSTRQ